MAEWQNEGRSDGTIGSRKDFCDLVYALRFRERALNTNSSPFVLVTR
jgi:hypothetical protein